jgi:hypothetical protein
LVCEEVTIVRYYKLIEDGYILLIGRGSGGIEITKKEYELLLSHINSKPEAEEGYGYRLKEDLTWELYELPPVPEDDEISSDELMDMIEEVL